MDFEPQSSPSYIKAGHSIDIDSSKAVNEALSGFELSSTCFILAFVPDTLDIDEVSATLYQSAKGVPVFGCTTAGQITKDGYDSQALLLLAFPKENFRCASILFEDLAPISTTKVAIKAQRQAELFKHTAGWNRLALLFCDGLSKQEDLLVSALDTVLHDLPIFGGSAGDGFKYDTTFVIYGGEAHTNAAVLLLLETNLEFQGIGFDHFLASGPQIVITNADPEERLVYEINGAPAAEEYARLVGYPVEHLSPEIFAEYPVLLRHNRKYYVRAIRNVTDNHAMSFLAAIDDGLILTLGRGKEIIETLESGLDIKNGNGKSPDFVLGFDCALRRLEIQQKQLHRRVSEIFRQKRVLGFSTYGEQQAGIHMNQTFVGVAFFEPEPKPFLL